MSSIDPKQIFKAMYKAFIDECREQGMQMLPELKATAESDFKSISERLVTISKEVAEKKISQAEAKSLLAMQQDEIEIQLLTIAGESKIILQNSLNAAFKVLHDALDKLFKIF